MEYHDLQHFSICDREFIDIVTKPLCFVSELTFDHNTCFYCSHLKIWASSKDFTLRQMWLQLQLEACPAYVEFIVSGTVLWSMVCWQW